MSLIIGTAGHVDHGKSTLVKALTGRDPDRLEEEKRREMTIDLGFAWMQTEVGEIGFIDVPGHIDFIENMLAGVGGIDAALIVIDAEEGIMPQTREHIDILQLLEISQAIVVVTKIDKVDSDWLNLMQEDISTYLSETIYKSSPIITVSALTGEGLDVLRSLLMNLTSLEDSHALTASPWLPIDRVFSKEGFGTIVTGTLLEGVLHTGDEIIILPQALKVRIRGIQNYEIKSDAAFPGKRTAINLSGISVSEIHRGDVITTPLGADNTQLIDIKLSMLSGRDKFIKHNDTVKFFCGTCERVANVRVMIDQEIAPDTQGFAQLVFDDPVVVRRGDRFIIRRPSPSETLGGGIILNPHPGRKLRRFTEATYKYFSSYEKKDPADMLLEKLRKHFFFSERTAISESGLSDDAFFEIFNKLLSGGKIIARAPLFITEESLKHLTDKGIQVLDIFHTAAPLLRGIQRESFRQKMQLEIPEFNELQRFMSENRLIDTNGFLIWKTGHQPRYTKSQTLSLKVFFAQLENQPSNPPNIDEAIKELGKDVFDSLVLSDELIVLSDQIFFRKKHYEHFKAQIVNQIRQDGKLTVAQVRDLLGSSRKYVLALLEKLDREGVTKRDGDYRFLLPRYDEKASRGDNNGAS